MAIKVGYQGNHGTFSEIAVLEFFKGQEIELCGDVNFPKIMTACHNGELDYALLPVENTTTGIIARTMDLFVDYNIYAVGEIVVPIKEDLIVVPGTKLEEIREVYSHPEALSQCTGFTNAHPYIKPMAWQDTSAAVEYVKQCNDHSKAAFASSRAAEYFGMETLMKDVQDSNTNMTRFLCVTNKKSVAEDADKTSLRFVVDHTPGSLYRAMEVLSAMNINVVKLESRPLPDQIFRYCFYLDFIGNVNDPIIAHCLKMIESRCDEFRVLGCYKAWENGK